MRKLLLFAIIIFCGCAGAKHTTTDEQSFAVYITMPKGSGSVNEVLSVLHSAQKPTKSKLYYPETPKGSVVIGEYWEKMDAKLVTRIKKYCEEIRDRLELSFDTKL